MVYRIPQRLSCSDAAAYRALQQQAQEEPRAKLAEFQREQCVRELIAPRVGFHLSEPIF